MFPELQTGTPPGSWHLTPSPYKRSPLNLSGAKGHRPSIPQRHTEEQACPRYSQYIKQKWRRAAAQERACCLQKFWESPYSASSSSGTTWGANISKHSDNRNTNLANSVFLGLGPCESAKETDYQLETVSFHNSERWGGFPGDAQLLRDGPGFKQ